MIAEKNGSISAEHGLGMSPLLCLLQLVRRGCFNPCGAPCGDRRIICSYKAQKRNADWTGVMKAPYIGYSQNETSVEMMRQIKNLFDPKGLLNPYKYVQ